MIELRTCILRRPSAICLLFRLDLLPLIVAHFYRFRAHSSKCKDRMEDRHVYRSTNSEPLLGRIKTESVNGTGPRIVSWVCKEHGLAVSKQWQNFPYRTFHLRKSAIINSAIRYTWVMLSHSRILIHPFGSLVAIFSGCFCYSVICGSLVCTPR